MIYEELSGGAALAYAAMKAALIAAAREDGLSIDKMVMRDIKPKDLGFINEVWTADLSGGADNDYNEYYSQVVPDNTYIGIIGVAALSGTTAGGAAATEEATVLKLYEGSTPVMMMPLNQLYKQSDGRGYFDTFTIIKQTVTAKGELYTPDASNEHYADIAILGKVLEPREKNINP